MKDLGWIGRPPVDTDGITPGDIGAVSESQVNDMIYNQGWGEAGSDTPTNDLTPNTSLPLPFGGNKLRDDVLRIRQALGLIDTRLIDLIKNAESLKSILQYESDDPLDDTSRFTKAMAEVGAVHIPDRNQVRARLGRDLVVGDLTISKPFYIIGNGGPAIDPASSVITKKTGSSFCIRFEGASNSAIIAGCGVRQVRMQGTEADTGVMIQGHFVSHLDLKDVAFNYFGGTAVRLKRVMESSIDLCYTRKVGGPGIPVIHLDSHENGYPGNNVNNLHITNCTFGYNSGRWLSVADDANVDMLWFEGNKLEWDGTPTNANTSSTEVVYLGQVSRAWIMDNGFTHFNHNQNSDENPGRNMYDGGADRSRRSLHRGNYSSV